MRELRQNLAGYVARARRGESVIISSRGQPVARLGPIDAGASAGLDPELDALRKIPGVQLPTLPWEPVDRADLTRARPLSGGRSFADWIVETRR